MRGTILYLLISGVGHEMKCLGHSAATDSEQTKLYGGVIVGSPKEVLSRGTKLKSRLGLDLHHLHDTRNSPWSITRLWCLEIAHGGMALS
jgi:hypothetical protein